MAACVEDGVFVPEEKRSKYNNDTYLRILSIENDVARQLLEIEYLPPVHLVYNPLEYAAEPHRNFVEKYGNSRKPVLLLGMNPGPFGMAQNGVPFGDPSYVRGWLGITGDVTKPISEHPKRPILGLHCQRKEVSGSRFWGLWEEICVSPEVFFKNCYVHNYCPLCFMAASGKNITPPMLKVTCRRELERVCDSALKEMIELLCPKTIVCIGKYSEERALKVIKGADTSSVEATVYLPHPSPLNVKVANNWNSTAVSILKETKLWDILRNNSST